MPSGATHTKASLAALPFLYVGAAGFFLFFHDPISATGIAVGATVGVFITPDIDHKARTVEEQRVYMISDRLGKAYEALWSPYAVLVGKHRGVSHVPILGTLTRAFYLLASLKIAQYVILGILWELGLQDSLYIPLVDRKIPIEIQFLFVFGILVGWMLMDFVHIALDAVLQESFEGQLFLRKRSK